MIISLVLLSQTTILGCNLPNMFWRFHSDESGNMSTYNRCLGIKNYRNNLKEKTLTYTTTQKGVLYVMLKRLETGYSEKKQK